MGKYLITQAQYQQVMSKNPSRFEGDERPVECVSWDDAVEFCQRLSKQTGKEYRLPSEAEWEYACRAGTTTAYYFGETITDELVNYGREAGQTTAVGNYSPNNFGLYDMHGNVWEWCQDDWHKNYEGAPKDGRAWLGDLYSSRTPARQFSWRKMSQNLIGRLLKRESLSGTSSAKVLRGGSCNYDPIYCRSACRGLNTRDSRYNDSGVRVVCVAPRTT